MVTRDKDAAWTECSLASLARHVIAQRSGDVCVSGHVVVTSENPPVAKSWRPHVEVFEHAVVVMPTVQVDKIELQILLERCRSMGAEVAHKPYTRSELICEAVECAIVHDVEIYLLVPAVPLPVTRLAAGRVRFVRVNQEMPSTGMPRAEQMGRVRALPHTDLGTRAMVPQVIQQIRQL